MRVPLVLSLLLLGALLVPVAAADHVYSHRYVVLGRVLDADGNPVLGVTVALALRGVGTEGACANQPGTETEAFGPTTTRPTTNALGEFTFCAHVHILPRASDAAQVELSVPQRNVTQAAPVDPLFRSSVVVLRLPAAEPAANGTALDVTHTVAGRLWREAPGEGVMLENVRVYGHTVNRVPVNVTVTTNEGHVLNASSVTNGYGDFSLRLPLPEGALPRGKVVVEALGKEYDAQMDASGLTYLKMRADPVEGPAPTPTTPAGSSPSTTPLPTVSIPISPVGNDGSGDRTNAGGAAANGTTPTGPSPETPFAAPVLVLGLVVAVALALRRRGQ